MWQLNLPSYQYNVKKTDKRWLIFDFIRKKFVHLTPEEWVRQHFLHFLTDEKQFPASRIAVEQQIEVNGMRKRCDAILYDSTMNPLAIVELKAPGITLTQETLDQASVYNTQLQIRFIFISNGIQHYFIQLLPDRKSYTLSENIPSYEQFLTF
jgi:type I site-specific restriction endonuclease